MRGLFAAGTIVAAALCSSGRAQETPRVDFISAAATAWATHALLLAAR